jgi:hypothetical protein
MPRRRPQRRPDASGAASSAAVSGAAEAIESWQGQEYRVRRLTGSGTAKSYRCPRCEHEIRPATPHVVVWPVEGSWRVADPADERRHWHTGCWRSRPGR